MEQYRTYVRSLIFLYAVCVRKILGQNYQAVILHSLDYSLYTEIRRGQETIPVSEEQASAIEKLMHEKAQADLPITKTYRRIEEAQEIFRNEGRYDEERLLHYRSSTNVNFYQMDGVSDYYYGPMLPSTGALTTFALRVYKEGVILQTPVPGKPGELQRFVPKPKLFSVFQQSRRWSRIAGVTDVGMLNDVIASGKIGDLIEVSEALHSRNLTEVAETISGKNNLSGTVVPGHTPKKLILIAGPSSSGKTTFAQKLCIQLQAEGLRPHLISMDNYFKNRKEVPYGENGMQDFESMQALDLELFKSQTSQLLHGQRVSVPSFDFVKGERYFSGKSLQLSDEDVLVVEGIHGLNPVISEGIARDEICKIYISAITQLSIDSHNRIPTTDTRLLRRIVRDYQHRSYSAADTLRRWPSVRAGEEKNIFPYQEEADVMFNSAHLYELAIMKSYAEPLLFQIHSDEPEYAEARRLIKFLSFFIGVSSEQVPSGSIIREFIGGGRYHQ